MADEPDDAVSGFRASTEARRQSFLNTIGPRVTVAGRRPLRLDALAWR
jgi:hypothetical protein